VSHDPLTAQADARELNKHLINLEKTGKLPNEIVVIGWGIGNGRFDTDFLDELKKLSLKYYKKIRYLLCDFSAKMLDDVRNEAYIKTHLEHLEFIQIDATQQLWQLSEGEVMLIRFNELYDDLPAQELFYYEGKFYELWWRAYINQGIQIKTNKNKIVKTEELVKMIRAYDLGELAKLDRPFLRKIKFEFKYRKIKDIENYPYGRLIKSKVNPLRKDSLSNGVKSANLTRCYIPVNFAAIKHFENSLKLLSPFGYMRFFDYYIVDCLVEETFRNIFLPRFSGSEFLPSSKQYITGSTNGSILKAVAESYGWKVAINSHKDYLKDILGEKYFSRWDIYDIIGEILDLFTTKKIDDLLSFGQDIFYVLEIIDKSLQTRGIGNFVSETEMRNLLPSLRSHLDVKISYVEIVKIVEALFEFKNDNMTVLVKKDPTALPCLFPLLFFGMVLNSSEKDYIKENLTDKIKELEYALTLDDKGCKDKCIEIAEQLEDNIAKMRKHEDFNDFRSTTIGNIIAESIYHGIDIFLDTGQLESLKYIALMTRIWEIIGSKCISGAYVEIRKSAEELIERLKRLEAIIELKQIPAMVVKKGKATPGGTLINTGHPDVQKVLAAFIKNEDDANEKKSTGEIFSCIVPFALLGAVSNELEISGAVLESSKLSIIQLVGIPYLIKQIKRQEDIQAEIEADIVADMEADIRIKPEMLLDIKEMIQTDILADTLKGYKLAYEKYGDLVADFIITNRIQIVGSHFEPWVVVHETCFPATPIFYTCIDAYEKGDKQALKIISHIINKMIEIDRKIMKRGGLWTDCRIDNLGFNKNSELLIIDPAAITDDPTESDFINKAFSYYTQAEHFESSIESGIGKQLSDIYLRQVGINDEDQYYLECIPEQRDILAEIGKRNYLKFGNATKRQPLQVNLTEDRVLAEFLSLIKGKPRFGDKGIFDAVIDDDRICIYRLSYDAKDQILYIKELGSFCDREVISDKDNPFSCIVPFMFLGAMNDLDGFKDKAYYDEVSKWIEENLNLFLFGLERGNIAVVGQQEISISKKGDKGFLVDQDTNTVIYYWQEAIKFLSKTYLFGNETLVILPSDSEVEVVVAGEKFVLSQPGALSIKPETLAHVVVLKGRVLVITTQNAPGWYERFGCCGKDKTGIVWEKNGIVAYSHNLRRDLWNINKGTEWIVDSSSKDIPVAGVSRVSYKEREGPVRFSSIRPQENIHRHPVRDGNKKMIEVYLVTKGIGALLVIQNGRPKPFFINSDNIAVIQPEVVHEIIAAQAPYEHLVVQVPSVFQYGFWFKENMDYKDVGITPDTHDKIMEAVLKRLKVSNDNLGDIVTDNYYGCFLFYLPFGLLGTMSDKTKISDDQRNNKIKTVITRIMARIRAKQKVFINQAQTITAEKVRVDKAGNIEARLTYKKEDGGIIKKKIKFKFKSIHNGQFECEFFDADIVDVKGDKKVGEISFGSHELEDIFINDTKQGKGYARLAISLMKLFLIFRGFKDSIIIATFTPSALDRKYKKVFFNVFKDGYESIRIPGFVSAKIDSNDDLDNLIEGLKQSPNEKSFFCVLPIPFVLLGAVGSTSEEAFSLLVGNSHRRDKAIIRNFYEKDGYVILDTELGDKRTVIKIAQELFRVIYLGGKLSLSATSISPETNLLIFTDMESSQPRYEEGENIFDYPYYMQRAKQLSEQDKWWQITEVKEIPIPRLRRMYTPILSRYFCILKFYKDQNISFQDFMVKSPLSVLDLNDGTYSVLDGLHRLDLACLLGFQNANFPAAIYRTKHENPKGYCVTARTLVYTVRLEEKHRLSNFIMGFINGIYVLREVFERFPEFTKCKREGSTLTMTFNFVKLPSKSEFSETDREFAYLKLIAAMERVSISDVLKAGVEEGIFDSSILGNTDNKHILGKGIFTCILPLGLFGMLAKPGEDVSIKTRRKIYNFVAGCQEVLERSIGPPVDSDPEQKERMDELLDSITKLFWPCFTVIDSSTDIQEILDVVEQLLNTLVQRIREYGVDDIEIDMQIDSMKAEFAEMKKSIPRGINSSIYFFCVFPIPFVLLGAVNSDDFSTWMLNKAKGYKDNFYNMTKEYQIEIVDKTQWMSDSLKDELKELISNSHGKRFTLDKLPKDERETIEADLHRDYFRMFHRYSSTFDFDKDVKRQLLRRYYSNTVFLRSIEELKSLKSAKFLIKCWYIEVSPKEAVDIINKAVDACKITTWVHTKGAVFSIIQVEGRHTVRVLAMPLDRYMAVKSNDSDVTDDERKLFDLINKMGDMGYFRGKVSKRLGESQGRLWLDFSKSTMGLFSLEKGTGNFKFLPLQRNGLDETIEMIWLLIELGGANKEKVFNEPGGDKKHYIFEFFGFKLPVNPTLQQVSGLPMLRYLDEVVNWTTRRIDKRSRIYRQAKEMIRRYFVGEFGELLIKEIKDLPIKVIPSVMTDIISTVKKLKLTDKKKDRLIAILESILIEEETPSLISSVALIRCGLEAIIRKIASQPDDIKTVNEVACAMIETLAFMKSYRKERSRWEELCDWSYKQKGELYINKYALFINHFQETIEQRDYEFLVSNEGIGVALGFVKKLYPEPFYSELKLSKRDRGFLKKFFGKILEGSMPFDSSNLSSVPNPKFNCFFLPVFGILNDDKKDNLPTSSMKIKRLIKKGIFKINPAGSNQSNIYPAASVPTKEEKRLPVIFMTVKINSAQGPITKENVDFIWDESILDAMSIRGKQKLADLLLNTIEVFKDDLIVYLSNLKKTRPPEINVVFAYRSPTSSMLRGSYFLGEAEDNKIYLMYALFRERFCRSFRFGIFNRMFSRLPNASKEYVSYPDISNNYNKKPEDKANHDAARSKDGRELSKKEVLYDIAPSQKMRRITYSEHRNILVASMYVEEFLKATGREDWIRKLNGLIIAQEKIRTAQFKLISGVVYKMGSPYRRIFYFDTDILENQLELALTEIHELGKILGFSHNDNLKLEEEYKSFVSRLKSNDVNPVREPRFLAEAFSNGVKEASFQNIRPTVIENPNSICEKVKDFFESKEPIVRYKTKYIINQKIKRKQNLKEIKKRGSLEVFGIHIPEEDGYWLGALLKKIKGLKTKRKKSKGENKELNAEIERLEKIKKVNQECPSVSGPSIMVRVWDEDKNPIAYLVLYSTRKGMKVLRSVLRPCDRINLFSGSLFEKLEEIFLNVALADKPKTRGFRKSGFNEIIAYLAGAYLFRKNYFEMTENKTQAILYAQAKLKKMDRDSNLKATYLIRILEEDIGYSIGEQTTISASLFDRFMGKGINILKAYDRLVGTCEDKTAGSIELWNFLNKRNGRDLPYRDLRQVLDDFNYPAVNVGTIAKYLFDEHYSQTKNLQEAYKKALAVLQKMKENSEKELRQRLERYDAKTKKYSQNVENGKENSEGHFGCFLLPIFGMFGNDELKLDERCNGEIKEKIKQGKYKIIKEFQDYRIYCNGCRSARFLYLTENINDAPQVFIWAQINNGNSAFDIVFSSLEAAEKFRQIFFRSLSYYLEALVYYKYTELDTGSYNNTIEKTEKNYPGFSNGIKKVFRLTAERERTKEHISLILQKLSPNIKKAIKGETRDYAQALPKEKRQRDKYINKYFGHKIRPYSEAFFALADIPSGLIRYRKAVINKFLQETFPKKYKSEALNVLDYWILLTRDVKEGILEIAEKRVSLELNDYLQELKRRQETMEAVLPLEVPIPLKEENQCISLRQHLGFCFGLLIAKKQSIQLKTERLIFRLYKGGDQNYDKVVVRVSLADNRYIGKFTIIRNKNSGKIVVKLDNGDIENVPNKDRVITLSKLLTGVDRSRTYIRWLEKDDRMPQPEVIFLRPRTKGGMVIPLNIRLSGSRDFIREIRAGKRFLGDEHAVRIGYSEWINGKKTEGIKIYRRKNKFVNQDVRVFVSRLKDKDSWVFNIILKVDGQILDKPRITKGLLWHVELLEWVRGERSYPPRIYKLSKKNAIFWQGASILNYNPLAGLPGCSDRLIQLKKGPHQLVYKEYSDGRRGFNIYVKGKFRIAYIFNSKTDEFRSYKSNFNNWRLGICPAPQEAELTLWECTSKKNKPGLENKRYAITRQVISREGKRRIIYWIALTSEAVEWKFYEQYKEILNKDDRIHIIARQDKDKKVTEISVAEVVFPASADNKELSKPVIECFGPFLSRHKKALIAREYLEWKEVFPARIRVQISKALTINFLGTHIGITERKDDWKKFSEAYLNLSEVNGKRGVDITPVVAPGITSDLYMRVNAERFGIGSSAGESRSSQFGCFLLPIFGMLDIKPILLDVHPNYSGSNEKEVSTHIKLERVVPIEGDIIYKQCIWVCSEINALWKNAGFTQRKRFSFIITGKYLYDCILIRIFNLLPYKVFIKEKTEKEIEIRDGVMAEFHFISSLIERGDTIYFKDAGYGDFLYTSFFKINHIDHSFYRNGKLQRSKQYGEYNSKADIYCWLTVEDLVKYREGLKNNNQNFACLFIPLLPVFGLAQDSNNNPEIPEIIVGVGGFSEKEYYQLAGKLLTAKDKEIFDLVDRFYNNVDFTGHQQKVKQIAEIVKEAPFVKEVYAIGYPFYGNVSIKAMIFKSLKQLSDGKIQQKDFIKDIIPGFNILIVFELRDKNQLPIKRKGSIRYFNKVFNEQLSLYRQEWGQIFKRLEDIGLARQFESPIEEFVNSGRLHLYISPIPELAWRNSPAFVYPDDINDFGYLRDLFFTTVEICNKVSDVPIQFRKNCILYFFSFFDQFNLQEEGFLYLQRFYINKHTWIYRSFANTREIFAKRCREILNLAQKEGLVSKKGAGTERGEVFSITEQGRKYLHDVLDWRWNLLADGYYSKGEYFNPGTFGCFFPLIPSLFGLVSDESGMQDAKSETADYPQELGKDWQDLNENPALRIRTKDELLQYPINVNGRQISVDRILRLLNTRRFSVLVLDEITEALQLVGDVDKLRGDRGDSIELIHQRLKKGYIQFIRNYKIKVNGSAKKIGRMLDDIDKELTGKTLLELLEAASTFLTKQIELSLEVGHLLVMRQKIKQEIVNYRNFYQPKLKEDLENILPRIYRLRSQGKLNKNHLDNSSKRFFINKKESDILNNEEIAMAINSLKPGSQLRRELENLLLEANEYRLRDIVNREILHFGLGHDYALRDHLAQEGMVVFIENLWRFIPYRAKVITLARRWIFVAVENYIFDYASSIVKRSRGKHIVKRKIKRVLGLFAHAHSCRCNIYSDSDAKWVVEKLNSANGDGKALWSIESLRRTWEKVDFKSDISFDEPRGKDGDCCPFGEFFGEEDKNLQRLLSNKEISRLISKFLDAAVIPLRDSLIMRCLYQLGEEAGTKCYREDKKRHTYARSLKDTGRIFGITANPVWEAHERTKKRILLILRESGGDLGKVIKRRIRDYAQAYPLERKQRAEYITKHFSHKIRPYSEAFFALADMPLELIQYRKAIVDQFLQEVFPEEYKSEALDIAHYWILLTSDIKEVILKLAEKKAQKQVKDYLQELKRRQEEMEVLPLKVSIPFLKEERRFVRLRRHLGFRLDLFFAAKNTRHFKAGGFIFRLHKGGDQNYDKVIVRVSLADDRYIGKFTIIRNKNSGKIVVKLDNGDIEKVARHKAVALSKVLTGVNRYRTYVCWLERNGSMPQPEVVSLRLRRGGGRVIPLNIRLSGSRDFIREIQAGRHFLKDEHAIIVPYGEIQDNKRVEGIRIYRRKNKFRRQDERVFISRPRNIDSWVFDIILKVDGKVLDKPKIIGLLWHEEMLEWARGERNYPVRTYELSKDNANFNQGSRNLEYNPFVKLPGCTFRMIRLKDGRHRLRPMVYPDGEKGFYVYVKGRFKFAYIYNRMTGKFQGYGLTVKNWLLGICPAPQETKIGLRKEGVETKHYFITHLVTFVRREEVRLYKISLSPDAIGWELYRQYKETLDENSQIQRVIVIVARRNNAEEIEEVNVAEILVSVDNKKLDKPVIKCFGPFLTRFKKARIARRFLEGADVIPIAMRAAISRALTVSLLGKHIYLTQRKAEWKKFSELYLNLSEVNGERGVDITPVGDEKSDLYMRVNAEELGIVPSADKSISSQFGCFFPLVFGVIAERQDLINRFTTVINMLRPIAVSPVEAANDEPTINEALGYLRYIFNSDNEIIESVINDVDADLTEFTEDQILELKENELQGLSLFGIYFDLKQAYFTLRCLEDSYQQSSDSYFQGAGHGKAAAAKRRSYKADLEKGFKEIHELLRALEIKAKKDRLGQICGILSLSPESKDGPKEIYCLFFPLIPLVFGMFGNDDIKHYYMSLTIQSICESLNNPESFLFKVAKDIVDKLAIEQGDTIITVGSGKNLFIEVELVRHNVRVLAFDPAFSHKAFGMPSIINVAKNILAKLNPENNIEFIPARFEDSDFEIEKDSVSGFVFSTAVMDIFRSAQRAEKIASGLKEEGFLLGDILDFPLAILESLGIEIRKPIIVGDWQKIFTAREYSLVRLKKKSSGGQFGCFFVLPAFALFGADREKGNKQSDSSLTGDEWTLFWDRGYPTSIGRPYDGRRLDFFRKFFESIRRVNPSARILEIGSGNLALSIFARAIGEKFQLDAIDIADIKPERISGAQDIRFHRRAVERSEFSDRAFDAVIGVYALEYTSFADALSELNRVMVDGAQAAFILNHRHSAYVRWAENSIRQIAEIYATDIFSLTRRFLENPTTSCRETLNGALATLRKDTRFYFGITVRDIEQVLAISTTKEALELLTNQKTWMDSDLKRYKTLFRVAIDDPAPLRALLIQSGFAVERFGPSYENIVVQDGVLYVPSLLGWELEIQKLSCSSSLSESNSSSSSLDCGNFSRIPSSSPKEDKPGSSQLLCLFPLVFGMFGEGSRSQSEVEKAISDFLGDALRKELRSRAKKKEEFPVPTFPSTSYQILDELQVTGEEQLLDIGSGHGSFVLPASTRVKKAVGFELILKFNKKALEFERELVKKGLVDPEKVQLRQGNFMDEDFSKYDILYWFKGQLKRVTEEELVGKIIREMKPGAKLIVHAIYDSCFHLGDWSSFNVSELRNGAAAVYERKPSAFFCCVFLPLPETSKAKSVFERIIIEAVRQNKVAFWKVFQKCKNVGMPWQMEAGYTNDVSKEKRLSAKVLEEACDLAWEDLERRILFLQEYAGIEINLLMRQAKNVFGRFGHAFLVAGFKDEHFLIDTVFEEFFSEEEQQEGDRGYAGYIVRRISQETGNNWRLLADELRKYGYIRLTDEVADMYGCALRGEYPLDRNFKVKHFLEDSTKKTQWSYPPSIIDGLMGKLELPGNIDEIISGLGVPAQNLSQKWISIGIGRDNLHDIDISRIDNLHRRLTEMGLFCKESHNFESMVHLTEKEVEGILLPFNLSHYKISLDGAFFIGCLSTTFKSLAKFAFNRDKRIEIVIPLDTTDYFSEQAAGCEINEECKFYPKVLKDVFGEFNYAVFVDGELFDGENSEDAQAVLRFYTSGEKFLDSLIINKLNSQPLIISSPKKDKSGPVKFACFFPLVFGMFAGNTENTIRKIFKDRNSISAVDLDTGLRHFVKHFGDLLRRIFKEVNIFGVEACAGFAELAHRNGFSVRCTNSEFDTTDLESDYKNIGLDDTSFDIVTINNINPERSYFLMPEVERILRSDGLVFIVVTKSECGFEEDIDIMYLLEEYGFKVEKVEILPSDYPRSKGFIEGVLLVARKR